MNINLSEGHNLLPFFQGTKYIKVLKMFLLKHLPSFLVIVSYLNMGEAAPKDVHIHLHGLDKELAKDNALGETEGVFG